MRGRFLAVLAVLAFLLLQGQSTSSRRLSMIDALLNGGSNGQVWTKDSAEVARGKWATSSGGSDPWTTVVLGADHTNTTTTPTTVPTLSFPVAANTQYAVECFLSVSAAATTTGVQITVTGPASPTAVTITRDYSTTATAAGRLSLSALGALNATASAGTAASIDMITMILRNGANAGTLGLQLDSEVAASAVTIRQGSHCRSRVLP